MRGTYLTAGLIALALVIWLASGLATSEEGPSNPTTIAQQNAEREARVADKAPARVRARLLQASSQPLQVSVRGRTESKRTVTVRSETSGRVVARPVERGDLVSRGDLLCRVATDDRQARITEATEALNQAKLEYEGSLKLQTKGLQSETGVAQAKARLASADAALERARLEMSKTYIRAPFAGYVENVHMNIGDFAQTGGGCADVVDLDPMLMVGRVQENMVGSVRTGTEATGTLASGETLTGVVSFVGQQSDSSTRTYAVEVELPNPDYAVRSGLTTEIKLNIGSRSAHRISPSILSLNELGQFGVKTLDGDNVVEFYPVEIVREGNDGLWVSGLPEVTRVITVGQDFVVVGEQVDPVFEGTGEMPASSEQSASDSDERLTGADIDGATSKALNSVDPGAQAS